MSLYVLVYDRRERKVVELTAFPGGDRRSADKYRLQAQREALDQDLDRDIVIFQAKSEEASPDSERTTAYRGKDG